MKFKNGDIPSNFKDMTGLVFGSLRVLEKSDVSLGGKARWVCSCSCGKALVVFGGSLRAGQQSCGCKRKSRLTHGMSGTKTFSIWRGMIQRCTNNKLESFKNYGGRGISVCDKWLSSFADFYSDMGECPEGYSIERNDVNGNYEPSNCKWIPINHQSKNRRNVAHVDGKTTPELSKELGIGYNTIRYRIKNGVDLNKRVGREIFLTKDGVTLSLKEWAEKLGFAKSTISMRMKRGLSTDLVLKEFKCDS